MAKDQTTVHLLFEGGATHKLTTTKAFADKIAGSVSRALTSGSPGQVRFELGDGSNTNYILMDGSRVLAVQIEAG